VGRAISRREFLRLAGAAGATVGLGVGLGGLLAACRGGEESTTTVTGTVITATTVPATTTTVSAGLEAGRQIKIGVVASRTGPLALFGATNDWAVDRFRDYAKDGLVTGDGRIHPFILIPADAQSSPGRAAQVTRDLIRNDKVDMVISAGAPETVNPSADQCEAAGVPSLSSSLSWQAFHFGRGGTPYRSFKWTYAMAPGLEQIVGSYADMWGDLTANMTVGGLWPEEATAQLWSDATTGTPPLIVEAGYKLITPVPYPPGSEDFMAQISEFKKSKCEIAVGSTPAADFINFWSQAVRQGFRPQAMTIGSALAFPEAAEAIGDIVIGCSSELSWHPSWPFLSSLTGETCQQLADDYEMRTGRQWSPALSQYAALEWAVNVLRRTRDLDDREEIVANVADTKMDTCCGPLDFTGSVRLRTDHPVPNVVRTPIAGGQWIRGVRHRYEIIPVSNRFAAGTEVMSAARPINYRQP